MLSTLQLVMLTGHVNEKKIDWLYRLVVCSVSMHRAQVMPGCARQKPYAMLHRLQASLSQATTAMQVR